MGFKAVDALLQRLVDEDHLAGASYAVSLHGRRIAGACIGWADREARIPLGPQHLFRAFSNTKLVTSCAALALMAQHAFGPDDAVQRWLPELSALRVLRPGATSLDDTEPARAPVLVRHLLTHTAGFSYGFLRPESPLARAYRDCGMSEPGSTLAEQVRRLGTLPLLSQPGSQWTYSVATDVLGRLLEVVTGEPLDRVLRRLVLDPLAMHDTGFTVPPGAGARLAALYAGDLAQPRRPGLRRMDHLPWPGAYLSPVPRLNPGGGLVTSLDDWMRLLDALAGGGAPVLPPRAMPWLVANQLPAGTVMGFPDVPPMAGRGHSFACSVTVTPDPADPADRAGDLQWGGLAGTRWWIAPEQGLAVALMLQRWQADAAVCWNAFRLAVRQALEVA